MRRVDEGATYRISPHAHCQPIDDGGIALHEAGGDYFELDSAGMVIWRRLAEPASAAEIGKALADAYGIERERANADGRRFLEELLNAGLAQEV